MQAYIDGQKIDILLPNCEWDQWIPASEPNWDWQNIDYRITTGPKLRPWDPLEVPVGARYRAIGMVNHCAIITGFTPRVITSSCFDAGNRDNGQIEFSEMLAGYEHSIDNGKTWQPCGVLE